MKQAWGIEGTYLYNMFTNKTLIYKAFVLKKRNVVAGS